MIPQPNSKSPPPPFSPTHHFERFPKESTSWINLVILDSEDQFKAVVGYTKGVFDVLGLHGACKWSWIILKCLSLQKTTLDRAFLYYEKFISFILKCKRDSLYLKGVKGLSLEAEEFWNVQVGRTITFSLFITLYRPVFNKPSRAHFFKYRHAVCWFVANCRYRQRIFFIYDTWRYTTKLWKCEP